MLLVRLPVMQEPFERIAMDIVSPLSMDIVTPLYAHSKKYIRVVYTYVCDYATGYPEGMAIWEIDRA